MIFVHDINYNSRVNGPGSRTVLHLAGCTIKCPGCFSAHTWAQDVDKHQREIAGVAKRLMSVPAYGLTISGGEPSEQLPALIELLGTPGLLAHFEEGGIIIYSGVERRELFRKPEWSQMCRSGMVDVVVVGPYKQELRISKPEYLLSSSNQELVFVTDLFMKQDFRALPVVEARVNPTTVTLQGFPGKEDVASTKALCSGAEGQGKTTHRPEADVRGG